MDMIARHVGVCIPNIRELYPQILFLQGSRGSVVDAWDWGTDLQNYDISVSKSAAFGADSVL